MFNFQDSPLNTNFIIILFIIIISMIIFKGLRPPAAGPPEATRLRGYKAEASSGLRGSSRGVLVLLGPPGRLLGPLGLLWAAKARFSRKP